MRNSGCRFLSFSNLRATTGDIFPLICIRDFIEKIIVYRAEKIDGVRTQRIRIIYNCVVAIVFQNWTKKRHSRTCDYAGFLQG
ncbi:MAG: DUF4368 domain-containing protein [Clostridiales bacterium]|nr:DUF4368 domain-containing protein [Clostridiales bacterium]